VRPSIISEKLDARKDRTLWKVIINVLLIDEFVA